MNDDTASAQAEGDALPVAHPALLAIERWYAAHFHRHAQDGTAPLSADDKAALIQHVADAVAPTAPKE